MAALGPGHPGARPSADAARGFEQPVAGTTDFANNEHVLSVTNALWQSYQLGVGRSGGARHRLESTTRRCLLGHRCCAASSASSAGARSADRSRLPKKKATPRSSQLGSGRRSREHGVREGRALVIRAMLQSPYFLYRTELGEDGAALSGYEVASKLSFWLLGTTPSDALLDAAGAGELDTADGAVQVATQMLEQPAASETMREFHRQLLHFDLYAMLSKIGVAGYTEALNPELEQASYRFFDRIYSQGLGLREILTSTTGYVGPAMAAVYGVAAPASGIEERDLGPAARRLLRAAAVSRAVRLQRAARPDSSRSHAQPGLPVRGPGQAGREPAADSAADARSDQSRDDHDADRRLRPAVPHVLHQSARLRVRELRRHGPSAQHGQRQAGRHAPRRIRSRRATSRSPAPRS